MINEKAALPGAALPESAAAKPQVLAADCRASGDSSARLTLDELNRLLQDEKLQATFESADKWTRSCWSTAIEHLAASGVPFCSDTCREIGAPEPSHPNHIGAFFMAAAKAGIIRPVGFIQSTRRQRHAAWMRQWVGGDAR
ncbi:hypothetical protein [Modestobacter lapidis]|nr:hypothetical protein [Modestobacter lapidis]